jgi:NAD(P)-dependent dehydrogenase (short-subunit alcohol dehydrogenase family)
MSKPTAVVVGVGAERGLGAALCRRFARGGYHVLVAGRTPAKIGRIAETIAAAGGSAEPIAMDATRESDVAGLFERAMAPGDGFDPNGPSGSTSTRTYPKLALALAVTSSRSGPDRLMP